MLADTHASDADAARDAHRALDAVLASFESLGYPREVVTQWSIPASDAADLVAQLRAALAGAAAPRILEVGTFVGTSALVMLLALPHATVHTVDPDFPLEIEFDAMHCGFRGANLARTTHEIAAAAAERLGVRDRLVLHRGGFATDATFAGRSATVPAIGARLAAEHGPFDAAFIDGLHFEDAVLADARLAAASVKPGAPILFHDAVGYWGSCVRRALVRFLEDAPGHTLWHAPFAALDRSIARLTADPPRAEPAAARLARCFGASAPLLADHIARAVTTQFGAVRAEAADEFSRACVAAFAASEPSTAAAGASTSAPLSARVALSAPDDGFAAGVGFTPGSDSATPPAPVTLATLAAPAQHPAPDLLILGFTPPGELHAAGPHSRPLAARVRELDALGYDAYDAIHPFLEPFSYALGGHCVLPRATTFLANTVVAVRRGSAAAARVPASLAPLTAAHARAIENARTQSLHAELVLAHFRGRYERAHGDLAAAGARIAELGHEVSNLTAEAAQAQNLRSRLQHMLGWRVHIGRHHFWRKPDARL